MTSRISEDQISKAFQKALGAKDLIGQDDTALIFYDLTFLDQRVENLLTHFPDTTLHAIAIKANPLTRILKRIETLGAGMEAATLPETGLAESSGFSADRIVFDSPAKTLADLLYALKSGFHVNADSFLELERIENILQENTFSTRSTIGVRINPQIGEGDISSSSVAGQYSKFGVPIQEQREALIEAFSRYSWLTGVHVHVGSQGCSLDMLTGGAEVIYNFVTQVNARIQESGQGTKIKVFDLGGGIPVAYSEKDQEISMPQYVSELKKKLPGLFNGDFKLITEFGRYVHANSGWVASKVEYVKESPGMKTAIVHVGADLFLRKSYKPEDWHHDIFVLDKEGNLKSGYDNCSYAVAGPLCFSGDMIAKGIELPEVEEGDYIIIRDTGAYTLGMWSRYNSRQIPKVIGYTDEGENFSTLRQRETVGDIVEFWS